MIAGRARRLLPGLERCVCRSPPAVKQLLPDIFAPCDPQSLKDRLPLLGEMIKEQRFLQSFLCGAARHVHRLAGEWIASGVVDAGCQRPRRRGELLDLLHAQLMAFEEEGDLDHVFYGAARMGADEVGDDRLAAVELPTARAKRLQEFLEDLRTRFAHDAGDPVAG